jgi:hypothetical protein
VGVVGDEDAEEDHGDSNDNDDLQAGLPIRGYGHLGTLQDTATTYTNYRGGGPHSQPASASSPEAEGRGPARSGTGELKESSFLEKRGNKT